MLAWKHNKYNAQRHKTRRFDLATGECSTPLQEGFSFHDVVRPHGYPHSASLDVDTPEEWNAFWDKHKYNAWELIHRYATLR